MMNKSDVAYLVTESYSQDDTGVMQKVTEKRKVFVKVSSVSGQEWFEGGRNGLNPQLRFKVFSFDYLGESLIEYKDKLYSIYRTYYDTTDQLDLYAEFRKGNYEQVH